MGRGQTAWEVARATKATHSEPALAVAAAVFMGHTDILNKTPQSMLERLPATLFCWQLQGRVLWWEFFRLRLSVFIFGDPERKRSKYH